MLITAIILSVVYLGCAIYKLKNIPESISETSYIWETNCDHKQWHKAHLFSIYCCLMAGLMFWPWIKITPEYWQFLHRQLEGLFHQRKHQLLIQFLEGPLATR